MITDATERAVLLLQLVVVTVDVVGLLAGGFLLSRGGRRAGLPRDVAVLIGFLAVYGLTTGLVTRMVFTNWFAVIRVWTHVVIFVAAPLLLFRGVVRARRRLRGGVLFAGLGVALVGVYLWASLVEPYRLVVSRHAVAAGPRLGEPVKIVVVADLQTDHVGEFEAEVFRRIDAERADLIILPGDYLQVDSRADFAREQAQLARLFQGLTHRPRLGTWAVDGDIDSAGESLRDTGVTVIGDETVRLAPGLQLIGLSRESSRRPIADWVLRAARDFAGYTIVVGHAPDFMNDVIEGHARPEALLLAGHTHGGQVVVPGFGPPVTLSSVPRRFAAGGLFRLGPSTLSISRGIGMERVFAPRIRLFCPPELVVIELLPREM